MFSKKTFVLLTLSLALAGAAHAATTVTLPDTSQSTSLSADVSEQARVTVPATLSFSVSNVRAATDSSLQSVTADTIVLNDGKALKISIEADAASFTAATGGSTTWSASDVTWDTGSPWTGITGGAGASGTLSNSAFNEVATSDDNASTLSTTSLKFTLAAKSTVDRAGSHTLSVTWKFQSI